MSKYKIVFIIVLMLLQISCDISHELIVKNSNQPGSSVTIYSNRSILPQSVEKYEEQLVIHVPTRDSIQKLTYFYGLGGWSDDAIRSMAEDIDSIIIVSDVKKIEYKNRKAIENFLFDRRKGLFNNILKIKS